MYQNLVSQSDSTISVSKTYYVYILASSTGNLYTGMTSNLKKRIWQHRNKLADGFTKKHNITRLLHVESLTHVHDAIAR
ncbi:GIY-YIG nuclease family protein [Planctomycetota bacterium]